MGPLVAIGAQVALTAVISTGVGAAVSMLTRSSVARQTHFDAVPERAANVYPPQPDVALQVASDPGGPQIGVFGHMRVGGRVVAYGKDGVATHVVVAIAGAPLTSVNGVYFNNQLLTLAGEQVVSGPYGSQVSSGAYVRIYGGSQVSADADLIAAFPGWSADHVGLEQTYAKITIFPASTYAPAFAAGLPDITFDVLGFPCYDPRNGAHNIANPATWTYSDNAALIDANYMIHELGAALPTSRIDWTSVAAAATVCDQTVTLKAGGFERRYRSALRWTTDERHEDVEARAGAAMGGGMYLVGTKYRQHVAAFTASSASITPDDYVGEGLQFSDATPIEQTANGVRGIFTSPFNNFEARDFPAYQDANALAQDGTPIWLDLDLSTVTSPSQAQRLARIAYLKTRFGTAASVSLRPAFFDVVSADVVSLTDDLAGLTGETYRVVADELSPDYSAELTLERDDSTWYAWTAATDEATFSPSAKLEGEPGLVPPSGWVYDALIPQTTLAAAAVNLIPSPSPGCDKCLVLFESTGNGVHIAEVTNTAQTVLQVGSFVAGGNLIRCELQAKNSATGELSESVTLGAARTPTAFADLNGQTFAGSPIIILGGVIAPQVIASSEGAATLQLYGSANTRASHLDVYRGSTADFSAAALLTTVTNANQTLAVTGTAGTVRYYWVLPKGGTLTDDTRSVSQPALVAF